MRGLLRPLLIPLLRRDPGEVARTARAFRIETEAGAEFVTHLGDAFLGGYNTMLRAPSLSEVRARGLEVPVHFRPFFFEGAAMGYLPRSFYDSSVGAERAERDLLGMDDRFLYLYYIGLGFWYGFRHREKPEALLGLERYLDPLYYPLCFDGFGFKSGFFDFRDPERVLARLARVPEPHRRFAWQGLGRSLHFVYQDDPAAFDALRARLGPDADHLEVGRSLGLAFTGIDRPAAVASHLDSARDDKQLGARLTGVTWALAARQMNDVDYFARCVGGHEARSRFESMLAICDAVRARSSDYAGWQRDTRSELLARFAQGSAG